MPSIFPKYTHPDFNQSLFKNAPNCKTQKVVQNGVAPKNFYSTSIYPEYFKVEGKWILPAGSRMDCVPVIADKQNIEIVEFRNLKIGDDVVVGRTEDASEGVYLHKNGFRQKNMSTDSFAFRNGRSRETAFSKDYDRLYERLRHDRDHGHIVWVMGPAVVFDYDSRKALSSLIEKGFIHAILAGNALATHDLEGGFLETALGQNIYTQESVPNGHYNHLELINEVRRSGSIESFINEGNVKDGVIKTCVENSIPIVLAGSIRDDGPLPSVYGDAYEAQDAMRKQTRIATTVICLATTLHTIATGNMTPSYTFSEGKVRPVFIYNIDISEFAVNKLIDRGSLEVTSIVTNVQDFIVHLKNNLVLGE
jgi:lysine-ketoglutarate reductase/saccharopine dehydrogenase-like protein (TIGR00300 family)